jgi:uncharacterized protein involved in cysteine biosynthesis
LLKRKKTAFWSTVKSLNKQRAGSKVQTIDGISGENDIAHLMASNLKKFSILILLRLVILSLLALIPHCLCHS